MKLLLCLLFFGLTFQLCAQPRDVAAELDQIKERLSKLEAGPVHEPVIGPRLIGDKEANEKTLAKMKAIVIPELSFRDAHILDVISFLVETSRERDPVKLPGTGDGEGVNIIVNATQPVPRITLSLRRVTLADALTFFADLAELEITVQNGIVILKSLEAVDIRIGKRLDELAKTLDLDGEKAKAFKQAADEIKRLSSQTADPLDLPIPDPDFFPRGFSGPAK